MGKPTMKKSPPTNTLCQLRMRLYYGSERRDWTVLSRKRLTVETRQESSTHDSRRARELSTKLIHTDERDPLHDRNPRCTDTLTGDKGKKLSRFPRVTPINPVPFTESKTGSWAVLNCDPIPRHKPNRTFAGVDDDGVPAL